MKKVVVIACGAYVDSGYGCAGEWRCLKGAALGEGYYEEPSHVIGFVKCECPGRTFLPNLGMTMQLSEMKPDVIHLSSCLVKANPGCPYISADEMAGMIEKKTGIPVVQGTHEYDVKF